MQDKIIGPLTLIQFIYLMAGGMIVYIAYETLGGGVFYLVAIPVGLLSLGLTFLKIQDQPFSKFLLSLILYISRPKRQIWYKIPDSEKFAEELKEKKKIKKEEHITHKKVEKSELEKLAQILDTRGIPEKEKNKGIKQKKANPQSNKNEVVDIFGK